MILDWNEDIYSVGIRKLDLQHKQLIGLINALHAQRESTDKEFIDRVFTTLITYTKQHFVDEEKILKKLHYPKLEPHKKQHFQFVHSLNGMKANYDKTGISPTVIDHLTNFLSDWIKNHILVEYKAYQAFLEA